MNVSLLMFKADGTRRDFPMTKERVIVGRKNSCDLRIPLSSVSRQHCEVRIEDGQVRIRDLGSSNGTYHNNVRVQEAVLSAGDEILVGPVLFTVVIDGKPEEIKPVRTIVGDTEAENDKTPAVAGDAVNEEVPIRIDHEESEMPEHIAAETHSPTVDLDDPIAALERLAAADDDGELSDEELKFLNDHDQ